MEQIEKKKRSKDEILEILVVVLLGLTALLTAWATWIGSLHGGNQATLEQGQKDNAHGDAFGLVTVIYSIVLFLLGIAGSFKSTTNKMVVIIIGIIGLIAASIYMLTLPLPTGFSLFSYFGK